jgi:hypothetical protein
MNGSAVFQARALYSEIYNALSIFNDDSCLDVDTNYIAERHNTNPSIHQTTTDNQRYSIYPNPNDGNFLLQQFVLDNNPVQIKIFDAIGRNIYSDEMLFTNAKGNLNMSNYVSGMYLLEISDSKNRVFRFKFVINK